MTKTRPSTELKHLTFNARTNFSTPHSKEGYHFVSWDEAKANPDYKQLVEHVFREQAARISQRKWSETHYCLFRGQYDKKFSEALKSKFIKEPMGDKYKEHATHIHNNQWYKLDFDDSDFIRNIAKAHRVSLVNEYRLITAALLCYSTEQFKGATLKQIACDEDGGCGDLWSPKTISYATPAILSDFKSKISKLEATDKNYFIINFSQKDERIFLYSWLRRKKKSACPEPLEKLMENFILYRINWNDESQVSRIVQTIRFNGFDVGDMPETSNELKKFLVTTIKNLNVELKRMDSSIILRRTMLAMGDPFINSTVDHYKLGDSPPDKNIESMLLFVAIRETFYEQGPSFALSPDFDGTMNSPLICLVLPSLTLYKEFLLSFFANDAVLPQFSMGKLSLFQIRNALEEKNSKRSAEFIHPDVISSSVVHECFTHNFVIAWHDLIFHALRSSMTRNKDFYRYIKQLFSRVKHFEMSKMIFEYTDLDMLAGANNAILAREAHAKCNYREEQSLKMVSILRQLHIMVPDIWNNPPQHNALILIIDMNINSHEWEKYLGCRPEKYIPQATRILKEEFSGYKHFSSQFFMDEFHHMKLLINTYPGRSIEYYIILRQVSYRIEDNCAIRLCNSLTENHTLNKIIQWHRNKGLYFKEHVTDLKDRSIENLSKKDLYTKLKMAVTYCKSTQSSIKSLDNNTIKNIFFRRACLNKISCDKAQKVSNELEAIITQYVDYKR